MFSLNLKNIRSAEEHVEETYQAQAFADAYAEEADLFSVTGPIALTLDVRKDKAVFQLTGQVRASLELMCSRCLEPFPLAVDASFDLRYEPRVVAADPVERELGDEDFGREFYEHDTIDLGQLVRERLYLSLPMKPLCQEGCRGLCPECGTNLNRGTCTCRHEWHDARLAALQALKKES